MAPPKVTQQVRHLEFRCPELPGWAGGTEVRLLGGGGGGGGWWEALRFAELASGWGTSAVWSASLGTGLRSGAAQHHIMKDPMENVLLRPRHSVGLPSVQRCTDHWDLGE